MKLYILAVGGTGSRVLRALTMLMAAGVRLGSDQYELVPVIIDPDGANADLTRAFRLLDDYSKIHDYISESIGNTKNRFFKTKIEKAFDNGSYILPFKEVNNKKFRDFIEFDSLHDDDDKAMMKMLFSDHNLDADMQVGFKGNPNIGSVVFEQIVQSDFFVNLCNQFQPGDRFFIISSIFGGTGASGFPLLLKTLREDANHPNAQAIRNAMIGAVTVLPYFQVKQSDDSEIDSTSFISKAKAALEYYDANIKNAVDGLYYVGDTLKSDPYENNDGGPAQLNCAHLIEFLAATTIIHFCNLPERPSDQPVDQHIYEFGVQDIDDNSPVTFDKLYDWTREEVGYPMAQLALMANALLAKKSYISSSLDANQFLHEYGNFYRGDFMNRLCKFCCTDYRDWLSEMSSNKRSLDLFSVNTGDKPFDGFIKGIAAKNDQWWRLKKDYDLFYQEINKAARKAGKYIKSSTGSDVNSYLFLEMFYNGTKSLIEKKFK